MDAAVLGQSAVQPVGRPLMAHARRRAHDKNPTFVDLETGMITGIRQRLDIIGCPRPGVVASATLMIPPPAVTQSDIYKGPAERVGAGSVQPSRRHDRALALLMPATASRSPACSTHTTHEPGRAVIRNQSVRLSANYLCPERRSDDGQTILEGTRTGLKSCPDLQFLALPLPAARGPPCSRQQNLSGAPAPGSETFTSQCA